MADPQASSVSQLVSVLIPTLITFIIFVTGFILLRKKQRRVYEPRNAVDTVPADLKPEESPSGAFSWVTSLMGKPETFLIQQAGVDGYFFLRFLFEFTIVCLLGCIILWPILFAVNATNGKSNPGFDFLAFGNVKNKWRYLAHIFLSWIYFGTVIFLIYREFMYYTIFRHVLQTTPLYDSLLSSRTLLLTEVPESFLKETELRNHFPTATNVWYARDYTELEEKVKERQKLAKKYEGALNKTITKAVNLRKKCLKKGKEAPTPADDLDKYLKDGKKRPTHKLKFLIGEKVDTLNYCPEKLGELNTEIKKAQAQHNSNPQIPSVFIEFPTQLELQKAYQGIPYSETLKNTKRFTGVTPDDIIWENLSLTPNKRRSKRILANTILTWTVIFWCIPVAVVGAISNINLLTKKVHFLSFINNMPSKLLGIITGLLPVIALAVLMSLVPPFIRKMGRVSGCITVQQVEAYCQSWYYGFLAVNSFIALTLASAATSAVPTIVDEPTKALSVLANKIPSAANFYISNTCLQGLTVPGGLVFQMVPLILAQFLGRILDKTPRAKWNRWNNLGQPAWSVTYPNYEFIAMIALVYAIISPLILGFTFFAFALIYIAWSYTLVYVLQPNKCDARGRNYPSSLLQIMVGIYLAEACLTALFVFGKNWVSVVLEGLMIVFTAVCHIYLKWKFLPLWETVPVSALKYASGDTTFQYPYHDQGRKEIQVEGENYWNGGNQLGSTAVENEQVLPNLNNNVGDETDDSVKRDGTILTKNTYDDKKPFNRVEDEEKAVASSEKQTPFAKGASTAQKPVSWITNFFKPSTITFDQVRDVMPACYFNYIEYNPDFIRNAYEDPSVNDPEPQIWVARDELGLSEIEKNKAIENGVDVTDEHANFNEKGDVQYTGPPPSYEEALKV